MMKKVLFTATVDSHILQFHMPYIQWFKDLGYEVHVASNGTNKMSNVDRKFNVPFERQPIKANCWEAYKVLRELVKQNHYEIVHCHTPMGAVLTRLACMRLKKTDEVKVLYTAHGFHFYKGAPLINWALYYPIEKWLSRYTDCLITMNEEDFSAAVNHKFKSEKIAFVHGVGVDIERFKPRSEQMKELLRKEYGFNITDFILIYVAELTPRKHQDLLIEMMKKLTIKIPEVKLLLVGNGELEKQYKQIVKESKLSDHIFFLGYRQDVHRLMGLSDLAVSASRQEGLPVNVMEAMATGLPLVVTDCRGNRDLVKNTINGYVVGMDDAEEFTKMVELLYSSSELREKFGHRSLSIMNAYSLHSTMSEMHPIYMGYMQLHPIDSIHEKHASENTSINPPEEKTTSSEQMTATIE